MRMFLTVVLLSAPAARAAASFAGDHSWQLVTVDGREFPRYFHVPVGELGVLRAGVPAPEPIPFQIDERDAQGRFALPEGSQPTQDEHPGIFDDDDQLVLAARDLGERGAVEGAAEIQITDPVTGDSGWAYLCLRGPQPPTERADVLYDAATDTISTSRYVLTFTPHTTSFFAFVGPEGKPGRNVLDRVKARITARFLLGILTFHRNEDDVTNTVVAWKAGPLRLIRRSNIRVRLGYGLPQPQVTAENIFTADTFESPSTVHIPFDLRYVLGDLMLRTYMDFDDLRDYRIFTADREPTAIGCGLPPPHIDGRPGDWFGMSGPEGTFVHVLRMGAALQGVRRRLIAVADRTPDPPERVSGNCPGVGYTLDHWEGIGRGTYWSDVIVRTFAQFKPGDERDFLRALDHPLQAQVHAASGPQ